MELQVLPPVEVEVAAEVLEQKTQVLPPSPGGQRQEQAWGMESQPLGSPWWMVKAALWVWAWMLGAGEEALEAPLALVPLLAGAEELWASSVAAVLAAVEVGVVAL
mmetsp:Transcript_58603/g.139684  ORF Transcript_58603/g.139684 Transcript_58603/m.139684 type:complete len:106 (-) Transcript_58603:419-736(-)